MKKTIGLMQIQAFSLLLALLFKTTDGLVFNSENIEKFASISVGFKAIVISNANFDDSSTADILLRLVASKKYNFAKMLNYIKYTKETAESFLNAYWDDPIAQELMIHPDVIACFDSGLAKAIIPRLDSFKPKNYHGFGAPLTMDQHRLLLQRLKDHPEFWGSHMAIEQAYSIDDGFYVKDFFRRGVDQFNEDMIDDLDIIAWWYENPDQVDQMTKLKKFLDKDIIQQKSQVAVHVLSILQNSGNSEQFISDYRYLCYFLSQKFKDSSILYAIWHCQLFIAVAVSCFKIEARDFDNKVISSHILTELLLTHEFHMIPPAYYRSIGYIVLTYKIEFNDDQVKLIQPKLEKLDQLLKASSHFFWGSLDRYLWLARCFYFDIFEGWPQSAIIESQKDLLLMFPANKVWTTSVFIPNERYLLNPVRFSKVECYDIHCLLREVHPLLLPEKCSEQGLLLEEPYLLAPMEDDDKLSYSLALALYLAVGLLHIGRKGLILADSEIFNIYHMPLDSELDGTLRQLVLQALRNSGLFEIIPYHVLVNSQ